MVEKLVSSPTRNLAYPKITPEFDPHCPSPRMFWEFCAIRMDEWWNRHEGLGPPYTADPALQRYVGDIPNVFRELDEPNEFLHNCIVDQGTEVALFGSVAFRLTNRIPVHASFGGVPRPEQLPEWKAHFLRARAMGIPTYTRIFQTPTTDQYFETLEELVTILKPLAKDIDNSPTMRDAYYHLQRINRIRNFFAWQVTADMLEAHAMNYDENSWCYLGPGPLHAFKLMYNRSIGQKEGMLIARRLHEVQHRALANTKIPFRLPPGYKELTLKNIEHALCEYYRWVKAHWRIST